MKSDGDGVEEVPDATLERRVLDLGASGPICCAPTSATGTRSNPLRSSRAAIADRAAADAAVAVAATAVDNAQRGREVRERIEHLRSLRRGLLAAADEERRLLEGEFRLGPLREADRLDGLLAATPGEPVEALRRELGVARGELTEIARGLYPAALARHGLTASLAAVAERAPLPVAFDARITAPESRSRSRSPPTA